MMWMRLIILCFRAMSCLCQCSRLAPKWKGEAALYRQGISKPAAVTGGGLGMD